MATRFGRARTVLELVANALDAKATRVEVQVDPTDLGWTYISVRDNGTGFTDFSHAYTVFSESGSAADPTQRGRFGLGAKLFLAICGEAMIKSGDHYLLFRQDGTRFAGDCPGELVTSVEGYASLDPPERLRLLKQLESVIPPPGTEIIVNGVALAHPEPLGAYEATLMDDQGTPRRARVVVYEGPGAMYEMGLPVEDLAASGLGLILDVQQKIPLGADRRSVSDQFKSACLTSLVSHGTALVPPERWAHSWIEFVWWTLVPAEQQLAFFKARWGESALVESPEYPEAGRRCVAAGRPLVQRTSLPSFLRFCASLPKATDVYATGTVSFGPTTTFQAGHAQSLETARVVAAATKIASHVLAQPVEIRICTSAEEIQGAYLSSETALEYLSADRAVVILSMHALGEDWFVRATTDPVEFLDLLIHEVAHGFTTESHLSDGFDDALSKAGALVATALARNPGWLP